MKEKIILKNKLSTKNVWEGMSHDFTNLGDAIREIIDNSISNYEKNGIHDSINVDIGNYNNPDGSLKCYDLVIEDYGTGIKDLDNAFTLGGTMSQDSSLNEHGYGFKHALAYMSPENSEFLITTKTLDDNMYVLCKAPMQLDKYEVLREEESDLLSSHGTRFEVQISPEKFNTLKTRVGGRKSMGRQVSSFSSLIRNFIDDLGYIYSLKIKDGLIINVNGIKVKPVEPKLVSSTVNKGREEVVLNGKNVVIEYKFGEKALSKIDKNHEVNNNIYTIPNQQNQGVEIRINGRLCEYKPLMNQIYGEVHPSFNYFYGMVNIISDDLVISSMTNKSKLDWSDPAMVDLLNYIVEKQPSPIRRLSDGSKSLVSKIDIIKHNFDVSNIAYNNCISEINYKLGDGQTSIIVNLFEKRSDGNVTLILAKNKTASLKDLGDIFTVINSFTILKPDENLVDIQYISDGYTNDVKDLFSKMWNKYKSLYGNLKYTLLTWSELGIS